MKKTNKPKGRTPFKGAPYHAHRRAHLPARDAEIATKFFDLGHNVDRIMRDMELGRTAVQQSLARIKEERGLDPHTRSSKSFQDRIVEFKEWLFDAANAKEDPCLKWIEIFG